MNTRSMSLDYLKRAGRCLKESKDAFQENDFPITIRRAQECVELSLKRGPALYGYEAQLVPASDIFSRNDAEEALMSAEDVFSSCNNLIEEIFEN